MDDGLADLGLPVSFGRSATTLRHNNKRRRAEDITAAELASMLSNPTLADLLDSATRPLQISINQSDKYDPTLPILCAFSAELASNLEQVRDL